VRLLTPVEEVFMTRHSLAAGLLACAALSACSQPPDPAPGMIGRTIVTNQRRR
jgi:hypothetical protein